MVNSGFLGLNLVPNARADTVGTIKVGAGQQEPYTHNFLSYQLTNKIGVNIRQTAERDSFFDEPGRLYPGVDIKALLIEETEFLPSVAIGLQSMVGHKRMAGEYVALSKRWRNFDLTGGAGWGRFGTAGHFDNPLKSLNPHFGKSRLLDGEMPLGPEDWFTGEKIGLFAGVEYFTPLDGLSMKMDWGADRYSAENTAIQGFETPSPWSIGLSYSPLSWMNGLIGMQGTDRYVARLVMQTGLRRLPLKRDIPDSKTLVKSERSDKNFDSGAIMSSASQDGARLSGLVQNHAAVSASLGLDKALSLPLQLGRSARHIANHAPPDVEKIIVKTRSRGLRGPVIALIRRDIEQALAHGQGSAEEIWRNVTFEESGGNAEGFYAQRWFDGDEQRTMRPVGFSVGLQNDFSLSEEDSGLLRRTSMIAGVNGPIFKGLLTGGMRWRVGLQNNLDRLSSIRPPSALPVRSDAAAFADRRLSLDRAYMTLARTPLQDLHIAASAGWLEEMFAGYGSEILYRPFGKRWALGAEGWQLFKRDPSMPYNLGLSGDARLSGFAHGYYDFATMPVTAKLSLGRYIAGDVGGTFSLLSRFRNGVQVEAFSTLTDRQDFDLFGGTTHADHGLRFIFPLGKVSRRLPENTFVDLRFRPFGRDTGQTLEKPFDLYGATTPFSLPHIVENWPEIVR